MKKTLKRLAVVSLAVMMALSMSVSAFAVEELGGDNSMKEKPDDETGEVISKAGVKQNGQDVTEGEGAQEKSVRGTYTALDNTVRIDKEIIIFNTRSQNTIVYLPNVKYSYTIEPATVADGKTITDEYELTSVIRSGNAEALSTTAATVEFSNTQGIKTGNTTISNATYVTTNTNGAVAAGYFDISFDPTKFTKPGVYRYKITEAEDTKTRALAGVIKGADASKYKDERFLDVYVQNKDGGGYEIYGYALYEGTKDDEFNARENGDIKEITAKTNGFVSDKNDGKSQTYSTSENDVDLYLTSNVKVQKHTTGAMADKNNDFPFQIVIKNDTIKGDPAISYQSDLTTDGSEATGQVNTRVSMASGTATIGAAAATSDIKLKDGEFIYIYGIPGKNAASTVLVKEYNNTDDTYTVSAKYDNAAKDVKCGSDTGASVEMAKAATAELNAAQTIDITKVQDLAEITNQLDSISPTNVVMRYAPYLFMAAAAVLILLLLKRRKSEEEE